MSIFSSNFVDTYNGKERQVIYEGWSLFASDKQNLNGCKSR